MESCSLSNSAMNNVFGGETVGCATSDSGTATNTNCNCAMRYSSDQYTWDSANPNGPITHTYNWGTSNDASIYNSCR